MAQDVVRLVYKRWAYTAMKWDLRLYQEDQADQQRDGRTKERIKPET
jgi:hypothetical protein